MGWSSSSWFDGAYVVLAAAAAMTAASVTGCDLFDASSSTTDAAPRASVPAGAAATATATPTPAPPSADLDARPNAWSAALKAHLTPTQRATHQRLTAALRRSLPSRSADYGDVLALVMLHGRGDLSWSGLQQIIVARALPPHPRGDDFLTAAAQPSYGFVDARMPERWRATWGEVAVAFHLGELTRAQYDALHRAAHPNCR
ncbi:MAG: hypothetical protein AAGN82_09085 [Myxococcota bacterium]